MSRINVKILNSITIPKHFDKKWTRYLNTFLKKTYNLHYFYNFKVKYIHNIYFDLNFIVELNL